MNKLRILLADDHLMLVEALRAVLGNSYEIVGSVQDGLALLDMAPLLSPDLIVLDIAMPLLGGLEAARQVKLRLPKVKILFLTMNEDPYVAVEAMHTGAVGLLLKKSAASELHVAIRTVVRGGTYMAPQL